jgi:hypothetical protein
MGNFLAKPFKGKLFKEKDEDEDWAIKSNWTCK